MLKEEELGFTKALEVAIKDAIRSAACLPPAPKRYACSNNKAKNDKFREWEKEKEKYDKEKKEFDRLTKEREKIIAQNNSRILFKKKVPPPPKPPAPLPPKPKEYVPCKNHYKKQVSGEYNEKVSKRSKELYYVFDETTGRLKKYKTFIEKIFSPN
ncbi:MAG: hypothetical protein ACI4R8_01555 [Candidatus Caccovivens sp.]